MTASTPVEEPARVRDVLLVAGGSPEHDYDYARLRILQLLDQQGMMRTEVCSRFPDPAVLDGVDLLVTYTCGLWPSERFELALPTYLEAGGRWLALHGSNALFDAEIGTAGRIRGTDYLATLGSHFLDHPPVFEFTVGPPPGEEHDIVAGLGEFRVEDEFYVMEPKGDFEVILEARPGPGPDGRPRILSASGEQLAPDETLPVMYTRSVGEGSLVYLTLGHASPAWVGQPERRCSWQSDVYETLLRRSIDWLLD